MRCSRHLLTLAVGLLLAGVPALAGAGLLALAAPALGTARAGTAPVPDLLVAGCSTAGALLLAWLAVTVLLATADEVRARRHPRRRTRELPGVPRLVRRLVALVVGVLLGSTALSAGAAERGAATAAPELGWAASAPATPGAAAPAALPDPGWAPLGPTVPRPAAPDRTGGSEVVVHRGDTLWSLASARCGPGAGPGEIAAEQQRLHAANLDVIGEDPDLLLPGQVLRLT
ncbi:nucleoid-associated protein YgaU [Kineococcus radiotolerans]|uniref:Nucleoid-associated protein YgaU n=1 Tax=Kineococcus radiotolerans TaxID=131568 RepID=A0A7W4TNF3_KINRA|nr:hypothetical protein [Kineococcus radiotolerans]MBB2902144.1 nucleoid-associated protein YgaU [Kineococcus radiotolerans]